MNQILATLLIMMIIWYVICICIEDPIILMPWLIIPFFPGMFMCYLAKCAWFRDVNVFVIVTVVFFIVNVIFSFYLCCRHITNKREDDKCRRIRLATNTILPERIKMQEDQCIYCKSRDLKYSRNIDGIYRYVCKTCGRSFDLPLLASQEIMEEAEKIKKG